MKDLPPFCKAMIGAATVATLMQVIVEVVHARHVAARKFAAVEKLFADENLIQDVRVSLKYMRIRHVAA